MAKADLDRAKELYPSCNMGEEEWRAFFDTPAGFSAMGAILGDIYDKVKAEDERAAGIRSTGRRPRRTGSLQDVYNVVFPLKYTMDPFPEAMEKLLNGRSHAQFAIRIGVHQTTMSRFLRGAAEPDMKMLEKIAATLDLEPAFFLEWRAMYVAALVKEALLRNPNMSVTSIREIKKAWKAGSE